MRKRGFTVITYYESRDGLKREAMEIHGLAKAMRAFAKFEKRGMRVAIMGPNGSIRAHTDGIEIWREYLEETETYTNMSGDGLKSFSSATALERQRAIRSAEALALLQERRQRPNN